MKKDNKIRSWKLRNDLTVEILQSGLRSSIFLNREYYEQYQNDYITAQYPTRAWATLLAARSDNKYLCHYVEYTYDGKNRHVKRWIDKDLIEVLNYNR